MFIRVMMGLAVQRRRSTQPTFLGIPSSSHTDIADQGETEENRHDTGGNGQDVLPIRFPNQVHEETDHQHGLST